jgi:3-hydroxyisobutyrate dehydrogenase
MAQATVLGLGAMGSRMARRLLDAGHRVTVWNRTAAATAPLAAAGAHVAATPRAAVAGSEFVISMVRDDAASQAVWLDPDTGALDALGEGAVGIESSTLTTGFVQGLADRFAAVGREFLDAPVAGSRPQADAGQLIYLVGGDAALLARAEPILRCLGGALHHAGVAGQGAALKLAVNTLFGVQVAALAEIIGGLQKAGVDPARAVEIIGALPVCSPAAKGVAVAMLGHSFPPMFPVDLVEKDFRFALAGAGAAGAVMPVAEATLGVFARAMQQGFGTDNLTGIVRLYR